MVSELTLKDQSLSSQHEFARFRAAVDILGRELQTAHATLTNADSLGKKHPSAYTFGLNFNTLMANFD